MSHCRQYLRTPLSRREMLSRCGNGFGALALAALGQDPAFAGPVPRAVGIQGAREPHYKPAARNVIFLYMDGGPSQMDTFDPKPRLKSEHGKPFGMKMEPTQFNNNGSTLASPWEFRPGGVSGLPVSDLFPRVRERADDLCVIRSMVSEFSEHTSANYFLHTGHGLVGRPSAGAWFTYGLGSENRELPAFVVLNGGLVPPGGTENFGSGFLPASYQGSIFTSGAVPVANIQRGEPSVASQDRKLDLVRRLDRSWLSRLGHSDAVESAVANHELAYRMQAAVPGLLDVNGESEAVRRLYGLEAEYAPTRIFARQCLLARRLVERGVRFIELTCPAVGGDRWDQHGGLKVGHENNARAVDQPIAGLLTDLKALGLLDSTLVLWAGEFGRTPFAQGSDGRDHNPFGFSVWVAGGGFRGGMAYGATDEYGYKAVENRVEIYDLYATILNQLGLDHTRLTYRFGGRDMRLTDVHGHVLRELLA
ncbi:MAG: DUF1501 domain-containing protein [Verrucomicrobiales bacterium]|nr:DUF1501 domain-containing protein [Verrucomicrobiales bacterium]